MTTVETLQSNSLKYWPSEISAQEKEASVLPRLIETQEQFISLLHLSDKSPDSWIQILQCTRFAPNLFLKHLIVLSDVGGEPLMRLKKTLSDNQVQSFSFIWKEKNYNYVFRSVNAAAWNNTNLHVDGKSISSSIELTNSMMDIIFILLYAGASLDYEFPPEVTDKAIIGSMIGDKKALDVFVRQRYLWVSRITGGATANSLGHLAQNYVKEFLVANLPTWDFTSKKLPLSNNTPSSHSSFDIIAKSPKNKYCAIEVSFQVTTNSTIERKSGQSAERLSWIHRAGHHIAYVIDGAGNFERRNALQTICNNSDCTVTFSKTSMTMLVTFLQGLDS